MILFECRASIEYIAMATTTSAQITYSKKVTIDDLLAEAKVIWNYVQDHREEKFGDILDAVTKAHRDFFTTYAIVVQAMVYNNLYHPKALTKFVKFITGKSLSSEKEYIETQAEYVVFLYKCTCKGHWSGKDVDHLRETTVKMMVEQSKDFKQLVAQCKEMVDEMDARFSAERRQETFEALMRIKKQHEGAN